MHKNAYTADVGHHLTKKFFFKFFRVDKQMHKNAYTAVLKKNKQQLRKNQKKSLFQELTFWY